MRSVLCLGLMLALALSLASCGRPEVVEGSAGTPIEAAKQEPCREAVDPYAEQNACLTCHSGIEMIRCSSSLMFQEILKVAEASGTNNRCVVCHGGDAEVRRAADVAKGTEAYTELADKAHTGTPAYFTSNPGPKEFYPDPGSPWVNENTCGPCHQWEVKTQWQSLMMTEAGKIQGTVWGFGVHEGEEAYHHMWANYDVETLEGDEVVGTDAYRAYMSELAEKEPLVFVHKMTQVPAAPDGGQDVMDDPSKAAFTYIRGECQRCHLGVQGKQRYGDYRGMGCSACHMPYGNMGMYEGGDEALQDAEAGRPLVHSLQAGVGAPVTAGDVSWTGIPVETCTTCHNRGRRIGVSFQGLMETAYASPWTPEGEPQQKLHGKNYLKLHEDLHKAKGFLCQDCHTTLDVHSSGKLCGSIAGAVEIECSDCHGTPKAYPWELPLGYMDEYDVEPKTGEPRGTAQTLPAFMDKGDYPTAGDGYLLTARGNPFGNVVRRGKKIEVHLASGAVTELSPLKLMTDENTLSFEARVAMVQVDAHMEEMECYTCHATWAPQCYGCHIKIDYSDGKTCEDWVEMGTRNTSDGLTGEHTEVAEEVKIPGSIKETRSYLRWENPPLGQNGEGRVSPVIPGCQTSITVINKDGKTAAANHIARIPNVEGGGPEGQRGIDMSPLHPHTVQKRARSCESCHCDPKALGYGIGGGDLMDDGSVDHVVDLETGDGRIIPGRTSTQMQGVPNLAGDWSQFVTREGEQTQTVGHHFKLSGPLSDEQRAHMERGGVCTACHQEIPDGSAAINLLHHTADMIGMLPKTDDEHSDLLHKTTLMAAWVQVGGGVLGGMIALGIVWRLRRRRRAKAA